MSIDPADTGSRIPDPDGALPDDMDVDFRPEDWLGPLPDESADLSGSADLGGSADKISDDFVARTFAAVQSDQTEIADEAAKLDETQFSAEFLAHYQLPPISTDFVSKAAERVSEDYAERDSHWREALTAYTAPEPSDAFVDRTLEVLDLPVPTAMGPRALETASSTTSVVSSSERFSPGLRLLPRRGRTAMITAALILITATAAFFSGLFDVPRYDTPLASSLSPQPWATSLARIEQRGKDGAVLRQTDGLLFAAHHASLGSTGAAD